MTLTGGYQRIMDYLLTNQAETLTMGNSILGSLGMDMVLSGCAVVNNNNGTVNIAPGLVYINNEILRFAGANNVLSDGSQTLTKGNYVTSFPVAFATGGSENVYKEAMAVVAAGENANVTQIKIKPVLFTLAQYIITSVQNYEQKGTIKPIYDISGTFLNNFDASGLGVTAAWIGWHICNGNAGTPNMAGCTLIGEGTFVDPVTGLQTGYNVGDAGGEQTHLLTPAETATPAGLPDLLDGPHNKPQDGGGSPEYYIRTQKAAANAQIPHNNMPPYQVVYWVIKI